MSSLPLESLLNLPQIRVLRCEVSDRALTIHVEMTAQGTLCHRCQQPVTDFYAHGEVLQLRHLPVFERQVYLHLQTKRYLCPRCPKRTATTQRGDWYDAAAGCTKAFANSLLRALVNSTLQDVARQHQVTYDCLRGLLQRRVATTIDWSQVKQLRILGLDEIALHKGHQDFVTIVSTQDEAGHPVLLAVLEGRTKETVKEFLASIPEHLRVTVRQVCSDLYDGFINAAKEVLPAAKVVADRFHVAKLYRAALETKRKSTLKRLKKELPKKEYEKLKGVMWALRRRAEDLRPEERELLELLFSYDGELRQAYRLCAELTGILDERHSVKSGREALLGWVKKVQASGLECFAKFLGTVQERFEEITNYFVSRLTSGWVEGFNNKIKVVKRRCYGLGSASSLYRRLWLDMRGLEEYA